MGRNRACVNVEKGHGHEKIKKGSPSCKFGAFSEILNLSCVINSSYEEEIIHYKTLLYFDAALPHPLAKQLSVFVGLYLSP